MISVLSPFPLKIWGYLVTHLSNTLNAWILFWKTWMATENCYYKKLLKAKLTTSKDVPSLLFLQRYVQPQLICTEHVKFSKVISLLHSSRWCVIYFSELYISTSVIIPSMFCAGAVEIVKSFIGLSASSKSVFTGGQCFGKKAPCSSATHFKLSSN